MKQSKRTRGTLAVLARFEGFLRRNRFDPQEIARLVGLSTLLPVFREALSGRKITLETAQEIACLSREKQVELGAILIGEGTITGRDIERVQGKGIGTLPFAIAKKTWKDEAKVRLSELLTKIKDQASSEYVARIEEAIKVL